jgi:hypothetical protein
MTVKTQRYREMIRRHDKGSLTTSREQEGPQKGRSHDARKFKGFARFSFPLSSFFFSSIFVLFHADGIPDAFICRRDCRRRNARERKRKLANETLDTARLSFSTFR